MKVPQKDVYTKMYTSESLRIEIEISKDTILKLRKQLLSDEEIVKELIEIAKQPIVSYVKSVKST